MGNLILADTDVIIDYFNGAPPMAETIETLIREERLALTAISVFELYAGVTGKKRLEAIKILIKNALVLPLEEEAAKEAAHLYTDLKSKGKPIGNQDLLITAIAKTHDLSLLTRNKDHFERLPGLQFYKN